MEKSVSKEYAPNISDVQNVPKISKRIESFSDCERLAFTTKSWLSEFTKDESSNGNVAFSIGYVVTYKNILYK